MPEKVGTSPPHSYTQPNGLDYRNTSPNDTKNLVHAEWKTSLKIYRSKKIGVLVL